MHDQAQITVPVPPHLDEVDSHYVYLLVSTECPAFKLGFTRALPVRLGALRSGHGEFDAEGSFVVRVGSRRTARELEASLKAYYNDEAWRASAPTPVPLRACSDVGGHTEWYTVRAFTPMLATLLDLLQKSRLASSVIGSSQSGLSPRGMSLAEALRQPATITAENVCFDMPKLQSRMCDDQCWLDYSEANFAFVRAWVEARWDRIVSITPRLPQSSRNFRRTLRFSGAVKNPDEQQPESKQASAAEWYEPCAHASVWLRGRANFMCRNYFYREQTPAIRGGFAVGFKIGPFFESAPERFMPPTDLPQRIRHWVTNL